MSSPTLEDALQGQILAPFSANEAAIRVVRAYKSVSGSTYQDLAMEYGMAPSRAHHLFVETADGEQSNRKIDGDLLERIAQKLDLSIDELLRLGRVADGESIERILKARGVNRGFSRHVIIADFENLFRGTSFPRIELSRWPIYRDEESAMLSGLNEALDWAHVSIGLTQKELHWEELLLIANQPHAYSAMLALAQMSAVGRQRSKLRAWRTFGDGRDHVDFRLRDVDGVLRSQGPERAFAMLTSHYLGLRGVGETTASYYLFFRCLNDELRPVSSFAYPMTPVAIEILRRKGYNIDIPSYKPEQKYRDYLFAVSELAKSVNQDPMNVAYALRQNQVFD